MHSMENCLDLLFYYEEPAFVASHYINIHTSCTLLLSMAVVAAMGLLSLWGDTKGRKHLPQTEDNYFCWPKIVSVHLCIIR